MTNFQPDANIWFALTQVASLWRIGFNHFDLLPVTRRSGLVGTLHDRLPKVWSGSRD